MAKKERTTVPKNVQAYYDAVVELTDAVCTEHLTSEYAFLAREVAAALSRKRPSPLLRGKPKTWGCGILYVLGQVNFLFDKSQTPHMPAIKLCELFGVSTSAASAKAKQIEGWLGIRIMDPRWSLPSTLEQNPMAWMIKVDGMIVDARMAPKHIQEEAVRLGLIPYVPAGEETGEQH
jgi:hypothetical protein